MIRVGAVEYLNTKPLVENFAAFAPGAALEYDLPSRLADRLAAAELDVALIPVAEYFRGDDYSIVPGVSISTRGPVLSVTLFSRVPMAKIRSVALDVGSRTSAALTQILLAEKFGLTPRLEPLPMDADPEAVTTDAVLLIGDRAMSACLPKFPYDYDLGQEWHDLTGLPFVYAVWAVRPGVDLRGVDEGLRQARDHGLMRNGVIARREAPAKGVDAGFLRRYFGTIIRYGLGPDEEAGMRKFYELLVRNRLAPGGRSVEYYHRPHAVQGR